MQSAISQVACFLSTEENLNPVHICTHALIRESRNREIALARTSPSSSCCQAGFPGTEQFSSLSDDLGSSFHGEDCSTLLVGCFIITVRYVDPCFVNVYRCRCVTETLFLTDTGARHQPHTRLSGEGCGILRITEENHPQPQPGTIWGEEWGTLS